MNDLILSILGSIGGTTIILGSLFGFLGKRYLSKVLEAERAQFAIELESHKNQLKYDTLFFEHLYDASNDLYKITQQVILKKRYPEMDWEEACEDMALNFEQNEEKLDQFLQKYYTALPPEIVESINRCISNCSEGKFEVIDLAVSRQGRKFAGEVYEILDKTCIKLKSHVDEKRNIQSQKKYKKNKDNQSLNSDSLKLAG